MKIRICSLLLLCSLGFSLFLLSGCHPAEESGGSPTDQTSTGSKLPPPSAPPSTAITVDGKPLDQSSDFTAERATVKYDPASHTLVIITLPADEKSASKPEANPDTSAADSSTPTPAAQPDAAITEPPGLKHHYYIKVTTDSPPNLVNHAYEISVNDKTLDAIKPDRTAAAAPKEITEMLKTGKNAIKIHLIKTASSQGNLIRSTITILDESNGKTKPVFLLQKTNSDPEFTKTVGLNAE